MTASAIVYAGLVITFAGAIFVAKPIPRLRMPMRGRGLAMVGVGVLLSGIGWAIPASESRTTRVDTPLDVFAPVWQFGEFHTLTIAAPPARVYEAIQRVRADEIFLFRTLTWIRRFGRPFPAGILNAGARESLIDLATRTTFVRLADDAPRELVVGTVIAAPAGARGSPTPQLFLRALPPGFVLATMNFAVTPDGSSGSVLSTETRVFANSPSARRRFAVYWRVIYPGSAIIRRMWLRAIRRRAVAP